MNAVLERNEAMKFVINGRTFDTVSSTAVAVSRGINPPYYNNSVGDSERRYEDVLYRTSKGALFVHSHSTEKFVKGGRPVTTDHADEIKTPEDAIRWIEATRAVVLDATGLPLPPEA
jgi:hypothetical protein